MVNAAAHGDKDLQDRPQTLSLGRCTGRAPLIKRHTVDILHHQRDAPTTAGVIAAHRARLVYRDDVGVTQARDDLNLALCPHPPANR